MTTTIKCTLFLAFAFSGSALAESIPLINNRPVAVATAPTNGSASLQSILNTIYGCNGCVNVQTDQQDAAMFITNPHTAVDVTIRAGNPNGVGIFSIYDNKPVDWATTLVLLGFIRRRVTQQKMG